jgi:hypothetical protein
MSFINQYPFSPNLSLEGHAPLVDSVRRCADRLHLDRFHPDRRQHDPQHRHPDARAGTQGERQHRQMVYFGLRARVLRLDADRWFTRRLLQRAHFRFFELAVQSGFCKLSDSILESACVAIRSVQPCFTESNMFTLSSVISLEPIAQSTIWHDLVIISRFLSTIHACHAEGCVFGSDQLMA